MARCDSTVEFPLLNDGDDVEFDVNIHVGDKIFKCHRSVLASAYPYFDVMFRKAFAESTSENITLYDVDSSAFQDVLEYLYCKEHDTDHLNITEGNIFSLLRTSEYLGMLDVKRRCVTYIVKNKSSLPNQIILDIFEYAVDVLKHNALINNLGEYIVKDFFVNFSQSDLFLDLSFDALITIFRKYQSPMSNENFFISSIFKDENILLNVLIRWLYHSPETRICFLEKLIETVNFNKISLDYIEHMFGEDKFSRDAFETSICNRFSLKEFVKATLKCTPSPPCKNVPFVRKKESTLHAFIQRGHTKFIMSINRSQREWFLSNKIDYSAYAGGRIIALNEPDCIYSLHLAMKNSLDLQIFQAHSSVRMQAQDTRLLTSPPVIVENFEMCGIKNSIYVYDQKIPLHGKMYKNTKSSSLDTFADEELRRGIYHYNCELDSWYPVSQMKESVHDACMTNDHNLMYLIGGATSDSSYSNLSKYFVQAYDKRTSEWAQLSKSAPKKCDRTMSWSRCCFFNGKIFRYMSDSREEKIETFDLVAGKWAVFRYNRLFHCRKDNIIPYENLLWMIGKCDVAIVDPYDAYSQLWYSSTLDCGTYSRSNPLLEIIVKAD